MEPDGGKIYNSFLDAFKGKDEEFRRIGERILTRLVTANMKNNAVDNGDGTYTHTFKATKASE